MLDDNAFTRFLCNVDQCLQVSMITLFQDQGINIYKTGYNLIKTIFTAD